MWAGLSGVEHDELPRGFRTLAGPGGKDLGLDMDHVDVTVLATQY